MLSVWIHGAHGLRSWVGLCCVEPPVYWIVVVFQCYPRLVDACLPLRAVRVATLWARQHAETFNPPKLVIWDSAVERPSEEPFGGHRGHGRASKFLNFGMLPWQCSGFRIYSSHYGSYSSRHFQPGSGEDLAQLRDALRRRRTRCRTS